MQKLLWHCAVLSNKEARNRTLCTKNDIISSGAEITEATVPGALELELIKRKKLPEDLYFGTNILAAQDYEDAHICYFSEFDLEKKADTDVFLNFDGIDTFADIFIDGALFAQTENMLIPYKFSLNALSAGKHEVFVHIFPASVRAAETELPARCRGQKYNVDSLGIRKAPYMYGWDIMPRCVSAGLWKDAYIEELPETRISDAYLFCAALNEDRCELQCVLHVLPGAEKLKELEIEITGKCGESSFSYTSFLYSSTSRHHMGVKDPVLWWPKNYGEPALYKTEIRLKKGGVTLDKRELNTGIRTVELERTSVAGSDGTFGFKVNGKKIFVMGTNWVPTDVLPCRISEYTLRGLRLADEIGCNAIRAWGGNVYPDEEFYSFCDSHGILVWQDFSMACGIYPNDERFCSLIKNEAETVIRLLRNHPSLALWSGDNECDEWYNWSKISAPDRDLYITDPGKNKLTRNIIADAVYWHDCTRPYLPSSPYIDEIVFSSGKKSSEDHIWGPRDYFKGDFYNKNSVCHFASETGYHGCPAPESIKKFIPENSLNGWGDGKVCSDANWLIHASQPTPDTSGPFAYRIPLMTGQVERLFGTVEGISIEEYAAKSQISQAEALKFFIEHFRVQKWYRTGLIWWNIIDGWPQFSDAVVDWFGNKKLAFYYIQRSQKPFCLIFDEPDETGEISLVAVNDTREDKTVEFTVYAAKESREVLTGTVSAASDKNAVAARFMPESGEYYIVSWHGGDTGKNHFVSDIGNGISLDEYTRALGEFFK